jgi:hypothetical protein
MFSGFKSRWITPIAWQCATTPTMVRAALAASLSVYLPLFTMRSNSSPPVASSIARCTADASS